MKALIALYYRREGKGGFAVPRYCLSSRYKIFDQIREMTSGHFVLDDVQDGDSYAYPVIFYQGVWSYGHCPTWGCTSKP